MTRYTGLVDHYRHRLPIAREARAIALGEGNTPLIKLENLPRQLGFENELYVKFEGLNPTGSFKDRGMTVAVTQAVHEGARAIICASTGNTSAAAAAYAVRAGITAFVLIPDGKIAMGKLAQAVVHGAVVVQIQGNFDDGMRLVKEVAQTSPVSIVNSINPYRLQGQKTAAFEIVEALGRAPDYHCLPVGNAGNITAHWIGYCECAGQETAACTYCEGACEIKAAETIKSRRNRRHRHSYWRPAELGSGLESAERVRRLVRRMLRRGNPCHAEAACRERGRVLRTCISGLALRCAARYQVRQDRGGKDCGLHPDRQRPEGPGYRDERRLERTDQGSGITRRCRENSAVEDGLSRRSLEFDWRMLKLPQTRRSPLSPEIQ